VQLQAHSFLEQLGPKIELDSARAWIDLRRTTTNSHSPLIRFD
jgi:hypothetical protein